MGSPETKYIAVDIVVPTLVTIVLFFLIWSTLRLLLVMSSEDSMLGVKIPQVKRLNPVVLAAKSNFKKRNTRVLVIFIVLMGVAMYYENRTLVVIASDVLPVLQILAGFVFWFQGRHAIRAERKASKWWLIGNTEELREAEEASSTHSASKSARDQFAYQQEEPHTVPRSYDQLVYPKPAGWLFIAAFAVTVVGSYILWISWDAIPDPLPSYRKMFGIEAGIKAKTAWNVFWLPLAAGLTGLLTFLGSYWLSFVKPKSKSDSSKNPAAASAGIRGLQAGLGMLTLVTMAMLNLIAMAGVLPDLQDHRELLVRIGVVGFLAGIVGLAIMIVVPMNKVRMASEKKGRRTQQGVESHFSSLGN